eukprot:m.24375 g.24375  ORF g.24375 m.24375 type:complete len:541 (-) comp11190_c0_seq1:25-1647(-)
MCEVVLDGESLTIQDLHKIAEGAKVAIAPRCWTEMARSEAVVREAVEKDKIVYGVTTGFGHLARTAVKPSKAAELQRNLILSHAAGVGEPFSIEQVRAALVLRINSLIKGISGVRRCTVELMVDFLNRGITPYVPQQGSVGASGDLAPLSHMAMTLLGEGKVYYKGDLVPAARALEAEKLEKLEPVQKEGLALINGTQIMTAVLGLALVRAYRMFEWALASTALGLDALKASISPFDPRIHRARPHPGQIYVAERILHYMQGSEILQSHQKQCGKVQDAYSLRTSPQVLGAVKDTLDYATGVVTREMNSVTDNPLIVDGDVLQSGNFHGEPIALVADFVAISLVELGNITERRVDRMVNPMVSELPPFLARGEAGLNSGYMIWQYTAAALASENKSLAFPASADSIPTSAYQEDHSSMGPIAARKALRILQNVERIVAVELMIACRALEFHNGMKTGPKLEKSRALVQQFLAENTSDRFWGDEFEAVLNMMLHTECPSAVIEDEELQQQEEEKKKEEKEQEATGKKCACSCSCGKSSDSE